VHGGRTWSGQGKHRIVVDDNDFDDPSVGGRLGIPGGPGLDEVLGGTISLSKALTHTGLDKLRIKRPGRVSAPVNSGRLAGDAMRSVLRHLRGLADIILLDCAPWDSRAGQVALGGASDGVYLVLKHQDADTPAAQELLQF